MDYFCNCVIYTGSTELAGYFMNPLLCLHLAGESLNLRQKTGKSV